MNKLKNKTWRRGIPRFGLHAFLLSSILVGSGFGLSWYHADKQRAVVARVEKLAGKVLYDFEYDPESKYTTFSSTQDAAPVPKWCVELLGIDFVSCVVGVSIDEKLISSDLEMLTELAYLQRLEVSFYGSNCDFNEISEMRTLKWLAVDSAIVDDYSPLAQLDKLETLILIETNLSDLKPLSKLTNLRTLKIDVAPVVDISPLAGLEKLEELTLICDQIENFEPLFELRNLKLLNISYGIDGYKERVKKLQTALPNCDVY